MWWWILHFSDEVLGTLTPLDDVPQWHSRALASVWCSDASSTGDFILYGGLLDYTDGPQSAVHIAGLLSLDLRDSWNAQTTTADNSIAGTNSNSN